MEISLENLYVDIWANRVTRNVWNGTLIKTLTCTLVKTDGLSLCYVEIPLISF